MQCLFKIQIMNYYICLWINANYQEYLGFPSTIEKITKFTQLHFKHNESDKNKDNYSIDVISEGTNGHSFIVFKHNISNKQIFYRFGHYYHNHGHEGEDETGTESKNSKVQHVQVSELNELFCDQQITEISTGDGHTLFLTSMGIVYGCGANWYAQLGMNFKTVKRVERPEIIPLLYDIISISSSEHNLCLDKDGAVWIFGYNFSVN